MTPAGDQSAITTTNTTRTVIGSCPLDCPDGCSWVVTVDDGPDGAVATRLRGNPEQPFTRGMLCKKVNPWLTYAAEPGRLLRPLKRVGPKGPGFSPEEAFVPISWDEAIAEIAQRFNTIIETDGPEAIWPFVGTGNVGSVQGCNLGTRIGLWNALGVADHQVSICSVSGHIGLGYSMGGATSADPEAVARASTLVIWGANPRVTSQHWWRFVTEARQLGTRVIVVDPVRTRTAASADLHIAPRVGTDGALALGLCRALVRAGAADESFLADRCVGWDPFAVEADGWTPERVTAECGITVEEFEGLVAALAADPRVLFKLGQGMQRHAAGGQAARTVSAVAAVLGSFQYLGCGVSYSTDPMYRLNRFKAGRGELMVKPRRSLAMTNLATNLHDLDDPPVKALFIYGANPVVSNPDTDRVRSGLERSDLFTVVVDIFHTATTDYADLVLPSTMQHEHWELNHSFAHRYLNLNVPAVAPAGECLSHTEIFRRLARAMGLTEPSLYATDRELVADLLDVAELTRAGITLESLEQTGWVAMPDTDDYQPMARTFPTESGRFQFVSERAGDDGYGAMIGYHRPAETATGDDDGDDGGYALVAIGADWYLNTVFATTKTTLGRAGEPVVRVHPDDAGRDGLVDGGRARFANDRGAFEAVVSVDPGLRRGIATTEKGWPGLGLNATVLDRDSDMGRGARYHDNIVRAEPLPG